MPVGAPLYPVNLVVEDRPCLVVGGGAVAARKASGLLECGAKVHVVSESLGEEILDLAGITFERRPYRPGEASSYSLVVAATDDPAVNRRVFLDGDASGVWVNAADDPGSCSFTLPSVVRQGGVMVTVSTGGQSPALSQWLKEHVASEMGPEYQKLAELLSSERERIKSTGLSTGAVDWKMAIGSDMLELLRSGQLEQARERLRACLSSS